MSLFADRTRELWQNFMPGRRLIKNPIGTDLFSLQVYDPSLEFKDFTPHTEFEKWALTEVSDFDDILDGMKPYTLTGGLYAVFIYKGLPSDFGAMFRFIFTIWLPQSEYEVDQREHFEVLGDKYKHNDPDSEEDVWIPIRRKE